METPSKVVRDLAQAVRGDVVKVIGVCLDGDEQVGTLTYCAGICARGGTGDRSKLMFARVTPSLRPGVPDCAGAAQIQPLAKYGISFRPIGQLSAVGDRHDMRCQPLHYRQGRMLVAVAALGDSLPRPRPDVSKGP